MVVEVEADRLKQPSASPEEAVAMENEEVASAANPKRCKEKDRKRPSFRQQWKDKHYRRKFLISMSIAGAFVVLGAGIGQLGSTFLDMQIITNTDVQKGSFFFTFGAIGYMVGSLICGLLYSRVNPYLLILVTTLSTGIVIGTTSLCSVYELMIFNRFLSGCFSGGMDIGGNTLHIALWGTEGEGLMQFLHFSFAFGGVMSPLYSEPFLASKSNEDNISATESTGHVMSLYNVSTSTTNRPRETNVKYAFLITCVLSIVAIIPFVFIYFSQDRSRSKSKEEDKSDSHRNQRNLPRKTMLFTLMLICSFYHVYCCIEDGFASFLMTFLVREYDSVSKSQGAFITAIFWASYATARFLMVFLCQIFSSLQLIIILTSLMVVSYTCFMISAHFGVVNALIVFAALAGFSMSGIFPAGLSWTEAEFIRISGPISSAILVCSALGATVNPIILGYLMDNVDNMWFAYLLFGETLLFALLFIVLLMFSRCYLNKRYAYNAESKIPIEANDQKTFLSEESQREEGNDRC